MKKVKYVFFTLFIILSLGVVNVYAKCTDEEIKELTSLASKIKVTYKHLGAVETEDGAKEYDHFTVTFKYLNDDFYISDNYGEKYLLEENKDSLSFEALTGTHNYIVNSNKCETKISEIKVKLPRFNKYSLDPLCEGIDGNDFSLCSKYLDYDVSYETFKTKLENYKKENQIKNNTNEEVKKFSLKNILSKITEFITKYQIYIIISLIVILIILIIIIVIKKKRKRGVLE